MLDRYNKKKRVLEKCRKETFKDYFEEWLWNEPEPVFRLVLLLLRIHYHLRRLVRAAKRVSLPPVILLPKERRA